MPQRVERIRHTTERHTEVRTNYMERIERHTVERATHHRSTDLRNETVHVVTERAVPTLTPVPPSRAPAQAAVAAARARTVAPTQPTPPVQVRIGRVELTVAPPTEQRTAATAASVPNRAAAVAPHPDLLAAHRRHPSRSSL